jgi:hypothetical protein
MTRYGTTWDDVEWGYAERELRRHQFSVPDDEFEAFMGSVHAARTAAEGGLRTEGEA